MLKATNLNYLSLFSGCGGLDLGFEKAGFRGLLSVDNDSVPLDVLKRNLGTPVSEMDLTVSLPKTRRHAHVLLAGSPCQGFSTAGLRDFHDPRNSLLLVTPRVAAQLLPEVVVAENVPGANVGLHRKYWDRLHGEMRALGYQCGDLHTDSSLLGVPQKRQRIFMIAWRTGKNVDLTVESQGQRTLADALGDMDGLANHDPRLLPLHSADRKIADRIGPGQKLTNSRGGDSAVHTWQIPEVFGRTNAGERAILEQILKIRRTERRRDFGDADPVNKRKLTNRYSTGAIAGLIAKNYLKDLGKFVDLTHTFNGKYRRQKMDIPSRTVDTRFGDPQLFLHPIESRPFTVREAARVQGFPDDFIFAGSARQQFRMIGNAVPPPVGSAVARLVKGILG